jgi:hypothetical protein
LVFGIAGFAAVSGFAAVFGASTPRRNRLGPCQECSRGISYKRVRRPSRPRSAPASCPFPVPLYLVVLRRRIRPAGDQRRSDKNAHIQGSFASLEDNQKPLCVEKKKRGLASTWTRYFGSNFGADFLRLGLATTFPIGDSSLGASAALASLRARKRCMFLRTARACRSTSAIACSPSSAAIRCRLALAMLSGEGVLDFLLVIRPPDFQRTKPAQSEGSSGQQRHSSTSVE